MGTRRDMLMGSALAAGFLVSGPARSQLKTPEGWPARTVTVVTPSGAGGPSENFRHYADALRETFGQSFILESTPGASGAIGLSRVLRSEPDGHTLLLASNSSLVLAPLVVPNFAVRTDQFDPIALLFRFRFLLLANPGLKTATVAELVTHAKANAGKLNFGSPGVGSGGHLVSELLVKRTGMSAVHVPYKATTQQMMDTVAGTLQFTFDTIGNSRGMVEGGKLVPLAVTGAVRSEAAPEIPTLLELGYPGFENLFVSVGLLARKGTPSSVIKALSGQISRLNEAGPIPAQLKASSYEVKPGSPEDYAASLAADRVTWSSVVKEIGVDIKG